MSASANLTGQVVAHISQRIQRGEYAMGQVLPPVAEMAHATTASAETVRNALRHLAQQGVVRGVKGQGTVVLRRPALGRVCVVKSQDEHTNLLLEHAVSLALIAAGYDVDLVPEFADFQVTRDWCHRLRHEPQRPEALVVLSNCRFSSERARRELGVLFTRVVVFDPDRRTDNPAPDHQAVVLDSRQAARTAMAHFLQLGHRRIAVFAGLEPGEDNHLAEVATYCRDLVEVAGGQFFPYYGTSAGADLVRLVRAQGVTAYWSVTDFQALRELRTLTQAGIRVPADVALLGRNDTPWATMVEPALSSMSLHPRGIAAAVAAALRTPAAPPIAPWRVAPQLVVRGTTGPAPGSPLSVP